MTTAPFPPPHVSHLTQRQRELATFVRRFILDKQYSPSLSECAQALGRNETVVNDHIKRLVKKGVLARAPHVARSLRVTAAWGPLLDEHRDAA